jgi:tetratricopeptide (TPR) repeat protein
MGRKALRGTAAALGCCLCFLLLCACSRPTDERPSKIPITTDSQEARELYLQGLDLFEKLRFTDARRYFEQAVARDEGFAQAHLLLAVTAPTTGEFYQSLNSALATIDSVSEGERLLIRSVEAGAKGDPSRQLELLTQLVAAYPDDERGHNLLGTFHFNRQEYEQAITAFERATTINPQFSMPYNDLGYSLRGLGRYADAEAAFKKYIELIPDEPNPYDSYADLLMKMGRFEESIANYRKALTFNPNFIGSLVGIGHNHMFLDLPETARDSFRKLQKIARNDSERRQALLWMAASYLHEGERRPALEQIRAMAELAEKNGDKATLSADIVLMGDILLHTGSAEEALDRYRVAVEVMEASDVPEEVKRTARRNHLYDEGRAALALGDAETARGKAAEYGQQVAVYAIPNELRQSHELVGRIALHDGDYETARAELGQADQQDPVVLYLLALAWKGSGDDQRAREMLEQVVEFNAIRFSYAFVRTKARRTLEEWD